MTEVLRFFVNRMGTPIGKMLIVTDSDRNLRAVDWTDYDARMRRLLSRQYAPVGFRLEPTHDLNCATDAIARYFAGELDAIDALSVKTGGTHFQREVWRALRAIPCGTTVSYAQLAGRIERPTAVRAVGLANGSNPVGLVIPCHRVIGSDGSLTGYGAGIERKRWLLEHEQRARR
ncbi:MAG TPA: methylated-DNA--[protein]-cysteine S-methyltransferase [Terriglobales bacterium]|jgi:methylated-DNA-[protein]-cysteine S-methyltransferase|nr:methylated-DNA--[protein]-cysteine S-methyltransferase [Terriglobales bacterium]